MNHCHSDNSIINNNKYYNYNFITITMKSFFQKIVTVFLKYNVFQLLASGAEYALKVVYLKF